MTRPRNHDRAPPKPDVPLPPGVPYLPWFTELMLLHDFPPGWLQFDGKVPDGKPVVNMAHTKENFYARL